MGTTEGSRADFSIEGVANTPLQPTDKKIILSSPQSMTFVNANDFIESNSQLAKCPPHIRHFSLLCPRPQLRFLYSLSLDPFTSTGKLF